MVFKPALVIYMVSPQDHLLLSTDMDKMHMEGLIT